MKHTNIIISITTPLTNSLKGLLMLVMTFTIFSLSAQEVEVSGQVRDAVTNESIPGATILLKGTIRGTTTDIDGNYKIKVFEGETVKFHKVVPFSLVSFSGINLVFFV